MKQLWIGLLEMKVIPDDIKSGYPTGFTNFVTWADSEDGFKKNVLECLEEHGWHLLSVERVRPVDTQSTSSEEIEEIIERGKDYPRACIYGTLHTYTVN